MAGKEGLNPKYTPENINELRAMRTLADADAIKGGARYVEDGRLEFTKTQVTLASFECMIDSTQLPEEMQKELWAAVFDSTRHTINLIKMQSKMSKEPELETQLNLDPAEPQDRRHWRGKNDDQRQYREIERESQQPSPPREKPEYFSTS